METFNSKKVFMDYLQKHEDEEINEPEPQENLPTDEENHDGDE